MTKARILYAATLHLHVRYVYLVNIFGEVRKHLCCRIESDWNSGSDAC